MRRNLTVECIIVGLCAAGFAAVAALGFAYGILPVGVVGVMAALVSVWVLAGSIFRTRLFDRVQARFAVADYGAARAMLDRAERNHLLFPIARIIVYQLYMKVSLAQDDTVLAERYAARLRHGGGDGWRYRTAYVIVLLNLDWGDIAAAKEEFEAFRAACIHSEIYRSRIRVLEAIFSNIEGEETPVPKEAKESKYPIVHRVVQKYC